MEGRHTQRPLSITQSYTTEESLHSEVTAKMLKGLYVP